VLIVHVNVEHDPAHHFQRPATPTVRRSLTTLCARGKEREGRLKKMQDGTRRGLPLETPPAGRGCAYAFPCCRTVSIVKGSVSQLKLRVVMSVRIKS
jgi:hypothetical protein